MTIPKKSAHSLTIGIFTDDFFPHSGGISRSIEIQIRELVALGHRVILFAPKTKFVAPDICEFVAMPTWRLPRTPSYMCSLRCSKKEVVDLAGRYDFDIVHSQNERGSLFLAARIARIKNIPHVHTFHSNFTGTHTSTPLLAAVGSLTYMRFVPWFLKRIRSDIQLLRVAYPRRLTGIESTRFARLDWQSIAMIAQYTDVFTSPADFMIKNINKITNNTYADRGFVIANGIHDVFANAKRTRDTGKTLRFLSCGRLDPEKRVDDIVQAFIQLDKKDAELYVIGSGGEEKKLKRLAAQSSAKDRIVFLGHISDPERIAHEYANADVFILASYRFDTQGMVLAEAASAGAAIIYVDDRLGVGVSPENAILGASNPDGIRRAMLDIYNDRPRLASMQRASKKMSPLFTARVMEDRFVAAYQSALAHKSR